MSKLLLCKECPSILGSRSFGFGPDSIRLKEYFTIIVRELSKAVTLGRLNKLLQSLDDVYSECSEAGWDGYDAFTITESAYFEAKKIIKNLPLTSIIPMPEIVPEPNGEISLEWYKEKRHVFVISVSGRNEIIYAGLFGINKTHGTEYFDESIPSIIIENLKRLYYQE